MAKKPPKDTESETGPVETREVRDRPRVDGTRPAGCMVYVSAAKPGDQGRSVKLSKGEVVVGRDEDCELVLRNDSVSRRHVRLTPVADGILVEDLGSKNGTTYLERKIDRATLPIGARLGVGDCQLDLLPLPGARTLQLSSRTSYCGLAGASLPMRRLYSLLEMMEGSDAPVLVEGETGTGKELVVRALHEKGPRSAQPLVVIDCGNMPVHLMESEMFGYRKGAFTGAVSDRAGAFETAAGGTVFLDEIGELPLELQPKLLRVLETCQVKRLGDTSYLPVDFRVLAATRRNLATEVSSGRFREDLFYRIAVIRIQLPPLRERREDIPALARHLASQISGGKVEKLDVECEERFMHTDWPGNVRELRNAVQRTLALGTAEDDPTMASLWPEKPQRSSSAPVDKYRQAREQTIREFDRAYLTDLMTRFDGNLSRAAKAAGISRNYLRELLRKHGLY
jgi:DNA-binding NtrC family response regulator